jgi:hypothetical protein
VTESIPAIQNNHDALIPQGLRMGFGWRMFPSKASKVRVPGFWSTFTVCELEAMAIEIVDLPINSMVMFYSEL